MEEQKTSRTYFLMVALITALAAGLRLYKINQGLWYDEIFSVTHFFREPFFELLTSMPDPNHHPLYSMVARLFILVLGEKEWTVRAPALIAGLATVPTLYWMGSRFLDRRSGLLASLILCFSGWHVWFSQDARGYTFMMLFSLLSSSLFLLNLEKRTAARGALYVIVSVAAAYSHLYALAVVLGHLMIGLAYCRRAREKRPLLPAALPLLALVLALILYAPLFTSLLHFSRTEGQITAGRNFSADFVYEVLVSWSAGPGHPLLSLPFLALAAWGTVKAARGNRLFFFTWLLPLLVGFGAPLLTGTFVYSRFYLYGMPGYLLLLAHGINSLPGRGAVADWTRKAAAAILVTLLLPGLVNYYKLGKQGLRPAAHWIEHNARGKRVIALGLAGNVFRYYYPDAVSYNPRGEIGPDVVTDTVVVVAHPWSVGRQNLQLLEARCGEPLVFPAAIYKENTVLIYRCY